MGDVETVWFLSRGEATMRAIYGRPRRYRVAEYDAFSDAERVAARTREFFRTEVHLPSGDTMIIYVEVPS